MFWYEKIILDLQKKQEEEESIKKIYIFGKRKQKKKPTRKLIKFYKSSPIEIEIRKQKIFAFSSNFSAFFFVDKKLKFVCELRTEKSKQKLKKIPIRKIELAEGVHYTVHTPNRIYTSKAIPAVIAFETEQTVE